VSTRTKTSLIVETRRGPSIAGTRTTVFSVMDSLKNGHSRELIKQLFLISEEQLEAVLEYIAEHREEVEREYLDIVRRSAERREYYEQVFWDRSPFPREMPDEERRRVLHEKLAKRQRASPPENERHDSPRSRS
jgi:uncharacterized protein (DUF433 family)